MSVFEDKSAMPDNANIRMAEDRIVFIGSPPPRSDAPVRVCQTLQEQHVDGADAAMSVRNLSRPRRGHDY